MHPGCNKQMPTNVRQKIQRTYAHAADLNRKKLVINSDSDKKIQTTKRKRKRKRRIITSESDSEEEELQ